MAGPEPVKTQYIEEECPICFDQLAEPGAAITHPRMVRLVRTMPKIRDVNSVSTPCGHLFHKGCVINTFKGYQIGLCPTCQKRLTLGILIPLRKLEDSCALCKRSLHGPPANLINKVMPSTRRKNLGNVAVLLTHCGHLCHRFCLLSTLSDKNPWNLRKCPECQRQITSNNKLTPVYTFGDVQAPAAPSGNNTSASHRLGKVTKTATSPVVKPPSLNRPAPSVGTVPPSTAFTNQSYNTGYAPAPLPTYSQTPQPQGNKSRKDKHDSNCCIV